MLCGVGGLQAYEAGIQGIIYPKEYGGTMPADFDAFYELVGAGWLWDAGVVADSPLPSCSPALPPPPTCPFGLSRLWFALTRNHVAASLSGVDSSRIRP